MQIGWTGLLLLTGKRIRSPAGLPGGNTGRVPRFLISFPGGSGAEGASLTFGVHCPLPRQPGGIQVQVGSTQDEGLVRSRVLRVPRRGLGSNHGWIGPGLCAVLVGQPRRGRRSFLAYVAQRGILESDPKPNLGLDQCPLSLFPRTLACLFLLQPLCPLPLSASGGLVAQGSSEEGIPLERRVGDLSEPYSCPQEPGELHIRCDQKCEQVGSL